MISCPLWPDCGCGTQSGPHTCEVQQECIKEYKKYGIDWNNTNPDGSDYHIMNLVDEEIYAKYRRNK